MKLPTLARDLAQSNAFSGEYCNIIIVLSPNMTGILHMTFSLLCLKNLFTLICFCRYFQNSRNKQRNQTIKFPWEFYCLVLQFLLFNVICLWYLQSTAATKTSSVINKDHNHKIIMMINKYLIIVFPYEDNGTNNSAQDYPEQIQLAVSAVLELGA